MLQNITIKYFLIFGTFFLLKNLEKMYPAFHKNIKQHNCF